MAEADPQKPFLGRDHYRDKYEVDPRYTAGADDFDNEYSLRNDDKGLLFETERLRMFFTLLNRQRVLLSGKRVLDIGCNYGFYANLFAYLRRSPDGVHGIDFIQSNIDNASRINPAVSYAQQDLYEGLAFEDDSFDFVLVNYVMNCITERRAEVLQAIESKVRSGGYLLFFDFFGDYRVNWIDLVEGGLRLQNPLPSAKRKMTRNRRMDTYPSISLAEMAETLTHCKAVDYATMHLPQNTFKYRWKKFLSSMSPGYSIERYSAILLQKS